MRVPIHAYSFQDYLAVEEVSIIKHEFLDGEIYVWQDRRRIEIRERPDKGAWPTPRTEESGHVRIPSLDCAIDIEALYGEAGGPA